MVRRRVRRKKRKPPVAKAVAPVVEQEELDTAEAVEEEQVVKEKPVVRRRRRRPRKVVEVVEPEAVVKEEPTPKPQRRVRRVRKVDVEVPAAPVEKGAGIGRVWSGEGPGYVDETVTGDDAVKFLLSVLDAGETIALRKVGDDFVLQKVSGVGTPIPSSGAPRAVMTKREMRQQATTEDYQEFREWWREMTFEEKVAEAAKDGVEWERSGVPTTDSIRLTVAYRAHHEIEKWKPEFQTRAARDALLYGEAV